MQLTQGKKQKGWWVIHNWGDPNVDWDGINDAAEFIGEGLRRWGRIGTNYKEKYGTVRVYCSLGWYQMFSVTHPGYAYSRYPNWLWHLDCMYISRLMPLINRVVVPYHEWLYTRYYGLALKKWPHLRLEILSGADYHELLGKYGVHLIRTEENCFEVRYDWHPDNWKRKTGNECD